MGKIILLNGPPSSGKDTAAKHIRAIFQRGELDPSTFGTEKPRCILDRFSMPIKRAFAGTMGLPITEDGAVEPYESGKESIIPMFGVSYRQWQIDFSESFLKSYNMQIFGELLVTRIKKRFLHNIANLIMVPDCGFQIEIDVLYENFAPEDILLVRCHRNGFTFQGDSRSWVRAPKGCAVFDPLNENLAAYLAQVEAGVNCWLKTPERMPREE
jgi:hypothetical protein